MTRLKPPKRSTRRTAKNVPQPTKHAHQPTKRNGTEYALNDR